MLEAARNGNEEKLAALLTPLNVNCHAEDGRKSTPLHLAAGYNRTRIVQLLLKYGADVQAKDKGLVDLQTPGMLFCGCYIPTSRKIEFSSPSKIAPEKKGPF